MSQIDEVLTHLQTENAELKRQFQFYRDRYELSLAASNDGLWDWDPNTNHLFISERWKKTLGLESETLDPHLSIWENRVHPEDLPAVKEALHNHLDGKTEQYSATYRIRRQDGSYITIQDRGKAIFDKDANPVRMAGCMTDISEQRPNWILANSEPMLAPSTEKEINGVVVTFTDIGVVSVFGYAIIDST